MNKREARAEGIRNGYSIAKENAERAANEWLQASSHETSVEEAIVNAALETEAEHFRQFAPFEHFSGAVNFCGDRADGLWDAYEAGVRSGATRAAREFVKTARVHLVDEPRHLEPEPEPTK